MGSTVNCELSGLTRPRNLLAVWFLSMNRKSRFSRFPKLSAILGQHVMVGTLGEIGTRSGVITSAGDSFEIRVFGRGARKPESIPVEMSNALGSSWKMGFL